MTYRTPRIVLVDDLRSFVDGRPTFSIGTPPHPDVEASLRFGPAALSFHMGLPAELVSLLQFLFTEVLDGRNESLADGIQQGLGRPPGSFADFARKAAAAGAWSDR